MSFQLVVAKGKHQGKGIKLKRSPFIIGRQKDCHLRAVSMEVSRQHCMLEIDGEQVRIKDLGSTNGTLVNNQKITGMVELHDQDLVQVGPLTLRFQTQAGIEARAATDTQAAVLASDDTHAGVEDTPPPADEDAAATWLMNFDDLPEAPAPEPVPAETPASSAQSILERYKNKK